MTMAISLVGSVLTSCRHLFGYNICKSSWYSINSHTLVRVACCLEVSIGSGRPGDVLSVPGNLVCLIVITTTSTFLLAKLFTI